MANSKKRCGYKYDDGKTCGREVYGNDEYCVFHCQDVDAKENDFNAALEKFIADVERNDKIDRYDFRGFIFPEVSFDDKEFRKKADFNSTHFTAEADFNETIFAANADLSSASFASNADFYSASFKADADFSKASFVSDANFNSARFAEYANFSKASFKAKTYFNSASFATYADFRSASFAEYADFRATSLAPNTYFGSTSFNSNADFNSASFKANADFNSASFKANTNFRSASFAEYADFSSTSFATYADFSSVRFSGVSNFTNTAFHGPLSFDNAYLKFMDKPNSEHGINFEGAVIEEANLWGIETLNGYSFRDSFLLSISFAERTLIDCDFTGAVFDAVHTRGWQPDNKTIENTKYIYTDYTKDEQSGKHAPVIDSRVPASGDFGNGANKDFNITHYLKERYKISRALPVPEYLRTSVVNYIQFFSDFIKVTQNINVEIHTMREGDKIRVEFLVDTKEEKERISYEFNEYLKIAKTEDVDNITVEINQRSEATEIEKKMIVVDLKNQIRSLKSDLEYKTLLLASEKEKVQILREFSEALKDPLKLLESPTAPASKAKEENLFVLKGNIKGFSEYIKDGKAQALVEHFITAVEKNAFGLKFHEISGGDSLKIIHNDVNELVRTAFRILEDLGDANVEPKPTSRMAIVFGKVDYTETNGGIELKPTTPLRLAARLEPCVTPGEIWCDEKVKTMIDQRKYKTEEITDSDRSDLEFNEHGMINIKKPDSAEADEFMKVYRIVKG
ncbi:hypothetical protein MCHI_002973 [Candidatus Magnetoovum chiemensis]|nr:hypothetical protein MCHI_002973 [Candidatus Magnetoovum chiemensis]